MTTATRITARRVTLPEGWPLAGVVAGFPLWWLLGLTDIAFVVAAVPLAWTLLRRGRIRTPPGFGLWLLFLIWVAVSAVALDVVAPGTIPPSGSGRFIAYAVRLGNYVALAVIVLYIGNTPPRWLPTRRIVAWLSLLTLWLVLLGVAALLRPELQVPTVFGSLVPGGSATAPLAQVQSVIGDASARPAAPFAYTNIWGNVLSLGLVWLVVGWVLDRRPAVRVAGVVIATVSVVPLVYSLNRAVWFGVALSVAYVAFRQVLRGRLLVVGLTAGLVLVAGLAVVTTPLGTVVEERSEAGHSDNVRALLADAAFDAARDSPIVGYGSTRALPGSGSSIAVGPSADCPQCGSRNIGSTGQLWLLLVAQGFVGTALFFAYLLRTAWSSRRDASPVGVAGTLTILLTVFYSAFYVSVGMPLVITFVAIGLLWRNQQAAAHQSVPVDARPRAVTA